ncbi:MAG TPA: hypothetical protein VKU38_07730 [Ktedonobacteraceae bacterium]|nr:hypothetical protein [Ktedonobacteraceae bacterium]
MTHLVTARARAGTNPNNDICWITSISILHRLNHRRNNAANDAFPSCVSHTNDMVLGIEEGNSRAIRYWNKEGTIDCAGNKPITREIKTS